MTISTFLPMRNKLAVEAFSLQKAVKMLEEVAVGWQESRWIWRQRRTFRRVQPVSAAVPRVLGAAVPKNQALSADQRRLQAGEFLMRLIDLLSVLLVMVSSGFRKLQWIRQAADHQTVTTFFLWCQHGFGKCCGASSQSNH